MTPILLGIPFAAVLAIILLSIGLRPARVAVVWLALVLAVGAASLVTGGATDAPSHPPETVARTSAERA